MKKSSTIFLQVVIVLIGICALALLLLEPRVEGVNANATSLYQIYFDDPFLMLVYAGSIPFFVALYMAFNMLSYVRQETVFSERGLHALRTIRYCALAIIGFVVVEEFIIMLTHGDDDAAGGVMIGVFIMCISVVVATAAAVFEKLLKTAVDLKSENDLTV